ncbi:TPA_asm: coat protein [ssRNA phage Zoerhiza.4_18]|uniref:Coat protein n=2 Tax=Norzivirales TaxID=2842247 RepID=A0A8S5KY92_9VIRU|nr:coat protein [ssRNA phage Zoerhiza.4_18]QDH90383.1 MAG: hypothetical protein H4Rhizo45207_000003 [Leviviridae sp.]DAD50147.1 TPA_asm: coat protein [ssRNA phage Zoerhiza.4_18]
MSLTINAKTYVADSFQKDIVGYVGPANTVSLKDTMKLARTAPKPSAAFSGVGRTQAKLTRTLSLTGALTSTADAIVDLQAQVPVGVASADVDAICADLSAYVGSAAFKSLLKQQLISY